MSSIAIVGTGIAGLGCGRMLHGDHEVTLFDGNAYAGGHSNTVMVSEGDRAIPIDTGFMVYNEVTYPALSRLFSELGVETEETPMSFGVQHLPRKIEYCGSSVNQLFAQRKNILSPRFMRLLSSISRFNRDAKDAIGSGELDGFSLHEYATSRGYDRDLLDLYVLPMSSAVWSTRLDDVRHFPAMTLLRFFENHGLLGGLSGHHQWRTVRGGSRTYVQRMISGFHDRIRTRSAVQRVFRSGSRASVRLEDGSLEHFDHVILACHADEALALLDEPTPLERRVLGAFRYQRNVAKLHTDARVMPRSRRAWAAWNYRIDRNPEGGLRSTTIYWMNELQRVSDRRDYFVSIDDPDIIDPGTVLREIVYFHPIMSMEAVDAQRELPALNRAAGSLRSSFCGSYFGYGFHEDAFVSSFEASALARGRSAEGAAA